MRAGSPHAAMQQQELGAVKLYTRSIWILATLGLPLMVLGIVAAVTQVSALVRYEPDYFADPYIARYSTPGAAAKALEVALQQDDGALLAELQGLRRPRRFEANLDISFVELWDQNAWYVTYLYFDELTYQRYLFAFEQVGERWVVAPDDLHYVMRSGRWKEFFLPLAIGWWVLGSTGFVATRLLRSSRRFREWVAGDEESVRPLE